MSKAKKRRNRKKARMAAKGIVAGYGPQKQHSPPLTVSTAAERADNRPTAQRLKRGTWAEPQGGQKSQQPMVDVASDMIGQLHCRRQITDSQEQAARSWQELRAAFIAELPEVSGYKSCLAGSVPGYDDGDGDPAVMAAYRALEARLSLPQRRAMLWTCDMGHEPANIAVLRTALNIVAGC